MGLMDILTGMQDGRRGGAGGSGGGGGMSPLTMALLGLLAYKAMKGFGGSSAPSPGPGDGPPPSGGAAAGGFGLEDILKGGLGQGSGGLGGLGGLLAGLGGAGGSGGGGLGGVLSGGLGDLLEQFQNAGRGDAAKSWVGTGQNQPISSDDLAQVLAPDQVDFLTQQTGMPRGDLLAGLSEQLPGLVDRLTPDGRLPTADEVDRTA